MKRGKTKENKREGRHAKIRARIVGTSERPRLAIYRSNKHVYAQIIDDAAGKTLAASNDRLIKDDGKKTDKSVLVGTDIAARAAKANIKQVVFDRGGFLYAGRVRALAEAARKGGLQF